MRRFLLGAALGVLLVALLFVPGSGPKTEGLKVETVKEGSLRYKVVFTTVESRYVQGVGPPSIIIVLSKPSDVPPIKNLQVWAKGPTVGKIVIDDAELRGNVVIVRRDGTFRKVLDDWLGFLGNDTSVEIPIEINIWFGDTYYGFATVHYVPKILAERKDHLVVAPRVYISPRNHDRGRANQQLRPISFGRDCRYEWRLNRTVFDSERDLGGLIPIFIGYNQDTNSALIGTFAEIPIIDRAWFRFGAALGSIPVGSRGDNMADVTIQRYEILGYDIRYNNAKISVISTIYPERAQIVGVRGRLVINYYTEWYVCYDRGIKVSETPTRNRKLQTDIFYIERNSDGSVSVWLQDVSPELVQSILRNNYTLITTRSVSPGQRVDLSETINNILRQNSCSSGHNFAITIPVGPILAFIFERPELASVLLAIDFEFQDVRGVDSRFVYVNYGASGSGTYSKTEQVDLYVTRQRVYINRDCAVNLPLFGLVSR